MKRRIARRKSIKNMSFHQLCEAIENGEEDSISGLDSFADETPEDTEDDMDIDTEEDTDDEMELEDEDTEMGGDTVTIEIDPSAPLSDILRTIADAIEGGSSDDEMELEDDMEDDDIDMEDDDDDMELEDDEDSDEDDDIVVDDEDEDEDEDAIEEQEESIADSRSGAYYAETNSTTRRTKSDKKYKNTAYPDNDLDVMSGDAFYATTDAKTTRRKADGSYERGASIKSRLGKGAAGKRITDLEK